MQGGGGVDFAESRVQRQMDASLELYRENDFVVGDTMSSWWESLKAANDGTAPGVCTTTISFFMLSSPCSIFCPLASTI